MEKRLFTSESVTEGHPDKVCDAISDAVLDAIMEQDPNGRVACETCTNTGFVLVMGEITTSANIDIPAIVRKTVEEIGYTDAAYGFDANTCAVMVSLDKQSADIALGVDKALEAKENQMTDSEIDAIGAGDQDCIASKPISGKTYPCILAGETYWMGFPHLYYPSNPAFARNFVEKAAKRKGVT